MGIHGPLAAPLGEGFAPARVGLPGTVEAVDVVEVGGIAIRCRFVGTTAAGATAADAARGGVAPGRAGSSTGFPSNAGAGTVAALLMTCDVELSEGRGAGARTSDRAGACRSPKKIPDASATATTPPTIALMGVEPRVTVRRRESSTSKASIEGKRASGRTASPRTTTC